MSKPAKPSKKAAGKGKGKGKAGAPADGMSVAAHPRASANVQRIKGLGGLLGFAIAAYLSSQAHVSVQQIGERSLIAGVAGYLLAWGCSVTVWRHLMLAELRAHLPQPADREPGALTSALASDPTVAD